MATFRVIAKTFDDLGGLPGKEAKKEKIKRLITAWREMNQEGFALLRLLLPHLDGDRSVYNLKQQKLGQLYIKVLGLDPNSIDAQAISNYKDPGKGRGKVATGDFGDTLKQAIRPRAKTSFPNPLTVMELNQQLDLLATGDTLQKQQVVSFLFNHCPVNEQIWIIRIVLKDLRLSMTEATILPLYHPDAYNLFQVCNNLKQICTDLADLNTKIERYPFKLFTPFAPQLSFRVDKLQEIVPMMENKPFWVETKLDGERIQMHYENGQYRWWSRNTKNYTNMYGSNTTTGSLVPFIHDHLNKKLKSCIFDGEMMEYNIETRTYEPFGTLKTSSIEVKKEQEGGTKAKTHPCYVVFDIVYLNGKSLKEHPLDQRYKQLERCIEIKHSEYLRLLPHKSVETLDQVLELLDTAMLQQEEGLIIKNPSSKYSPNEKGDWLKLKPDYIDSLCDDVDLLLVGGYYGEGKLAGRMNSFMCCLRDDTKPGNHYISLCKFGSGYKHEDLPSISLEQTNNWNRYNPRASPDWFYHPFNSDNPEMIIAPENSHVVQIRGTQIVPSTRFAAGYTLRFPRFSTLRADKRPDQILTLSELLESTKNNQNRRQRLLKDMPVESDKKRKRSTKAKVLDHFQTQTAYVEATSNLLEGIEFCVRITNETGDLSKSIAENTIRKYGGKITQMPTSNTNYIIADIITIQIKAMIESDKYDIIKYNYIKDCVSTNRILNLSARHIIHATMSTKRNLKTRVDKYGDSYTDQVDELSLKLIFDCMPLTSNFTVPVWSAGPALQQHISRKKTISEIDSRYIGSNSLHFFSKCVFYLDMFDRIQISREYGDEYIIPKQFVPSDFKTKLLITDIRAYSGTVVDEIVPETTHIVVIDTQRSSKVSQTLKLKGPKKRMVLLKWITDCIENKTLLDEYQYRPTT
ncbi:DNA ligase (ATP) [Boothiomyces sp. JEL0866]|nr:DNA ligase (ATP) [Boothiomyces sp. JEL0866]